MPMFQPTPKCNDIDPRHDINDNHQTPFPYPDAVMMNDLKYLCNILVFNYIL